MEDDAASTVTMGFAHFLLIGQLIAVLPAMPDGTELRIVSTDLLTVYASASVDDGELLFAEFPPPGTDIRIIIFPADGTPAERVESLHTGKALVGRISQDGTDVLLTEPESLEPLSLRELLLREREVSLRIAGQED